MLYIEACGFWGQVPATGKSGANAPLQTFAELLDGIGSDGSRAHNLNQACPLD